MRESWTVREELEAWSDPEGRTLDDVVKELRAAQRKYKEYICIRIVKIPYKYEVGEYWALEGERPETTQERERRLSRRSKIDEESREFRRKQYEQLKKEFE